MELLAGYSDSESDVDEELEEEGIPASGPRADYFGLNSSTDGEEDPAEDQRAKVGDPLMIDTLIESYQLSERPFGPARAKDESADSRCAASPPGRRRRAKRQRVQSCVPAAQGPAEWKTEPGKEVFRPHPSILGSLNRPTVSALPGRVKRTLRGHSGCVNALQWGLPLDVSHLLLSASMDGTVRVWNGLSERSESSAAWTGRPHGGAAVRCARWCPEGRLVASGGYDKMMRVTDVETGRETFGGKHPNFVTCLKYGPEPKLVMTGTRGSVGCWDTRQEAEKPARSFREDFQEVQDIEFLSGGNEFLCCSNFVSRDSADKAIMAWDFRTGAVLSNQIFRERYHCVQLKVHPSQACFMAQTNGNYIALFSTVLPYKMDAKKRLEGHKVEGYWTGFDVSPDGRYVISGSSDGLLYKYGLHRGHLLGTVRVSDAPCLAVACHPLLPSTVAASDWAGGVHVCH